MGDQKMAAVEHEMSERFLEELQSDGRALQNGKRGDTETLSRAVGRMAVVVVALARKPDSPSLDQCNALHRLTDERIAANTAAIQGAGGGNIWIKAGRFSMGSKSVLAFVAVSVIAGLTYLGRIYLDGTMFSEAAISRAVQSALPTALEKSLPQVLPDALEPLVKAESAAIGRKLGVERKDPPR